jgi:tetratricopeptide (TPR) repeat protein
MGSVDAAERDKGLRTFWSKVYAFGKIDTVSARFDEQTAEEILTMDGSITLDWRGNRYEVKGLAVPLLGKEIKREAEQDRSAPFLVGFPAYSRITATIKLPPGKAPFTLEGQDFERRVGGAEFRREAHIVGNVFTGEASMRTLVAEIPASEASFTRDESANLWDPKVYLQAPAGLLRAKQTGPSDPSVQLNQLFDPGKLSRLIDEGNQALNHKQFDQAIAKFDSALQANPSSAMALADRGVAYVWKGMNDRAREDLEAAFAIDAHNPVVSRGRGLMAYMGHNQTEAIAEFTTSLQEEPGSAFTRFYRARAYRASDALDKALMDVSEAIILRPDVIDYYMFRASLQRQRGQMDASLKDADTRSSRRAAHRPICSCAVRCFIPGADRKTWPKRT